MSFNTFGKIFRFTTWGESHGPAIGCVIDGCPPNIPISEKDIQIDMDRRRPGQSKFTTQRKESDKVIILSGVFEGKSTGTPISIIIYKLIFFCLCLRLLNFLLGDTAGRSVRVLIHDRRSALGSGELVFANFVNNARNLPLIPGPTCKEKKKKKSRNKKISFPFQKKNNKKITSAFGGH